MDVKLVTFLYRQLCFGGFAQPLGPFDENFLWFYAAWVGYGDYAGGWCDGGGDSGGDGPTQRDGDWDGSW